MWTGDVELQNLGRTLIDSVGISHPVVVDLCIEAVHGAAGYVNRAAAVRVLAGKYRNDERARGALETVAASDPDPALRQLASEALGKAQQQ